MMLYLFLAQVEEGVKFVDKVAGENLRWQLTACIVFIIFGGVLIVRYLIKDNKEMRATMQTTIDTLQKDYKDLSKTTHDESLKMLSQLFVVVQANNRYLEERGGDKIERNIKIEENQRLLKAILRKLGVDE